ncbi:hypothetical protein LXL04_013637 [Taraxacum kok-saghyz]
MAACCFELEIEIGLALKLEIVAALNWKSLHPLKSVLPVEIDLHPLKSVLHPLKSVLNWKSVLPVVIDLPEIGGVASNFSSREFASISNSSPNFVEKKKYKPKHVWNTDTTTYFIDMCLNEKLKGNKPGSHLNKAGWLNLEKAMLEKTGKLSNKWDGMKKDWKLYDRLMRLETGIGGTRSLIDASEEWWVEKINVSVTIIIVLASMPMHNYIRKAGIIDEAFNTAQQESYDPTPCPNTNGAQERQSRRPTGNEDSLWMAAYRDMIAEEIMNT